MPAGLEELRSRFLEVRPQAQCKPGEDDGRLLGSDFLFASDYGPSRQTLSTQDRRHGLLDNDGLHPRVQVSSFQRARPQPENEEEWRQGGVKKNQGDSSGPISARAVHIGDGTWRPGNNCADSSGFLYGRLLSLHAGGARYPSSAGDGELLSLIINHCNAASLAGP